MANRINLRRNTPVTELKIVLTNEYGDDFNSNDFQITISDSSIFKVTTATGAVPGKVRHYKKLDIAILIEGTDCQNNLLRLKKILLAI